LQGPHPASPSGQSAFLQQLPTANHQPPTNRRFDLIVALDRNVMDRILEDVPLEWRDHYNLKAGGASTPPCPTP
jgi:hypothetical protein